MPAHPARSPIRRVIASIVIVVGAIVCLIAIFADQLGIGGGKGFGYVQLIGLIVGIALILAGAATVLRSTIAPNTELPVSRER